MHTPVDCYTGGVPRELGWFKHPTCNGEFAGSNPALGFRADDVLKEAPIAAIHNQNKHTTHIVW